MIRIYLFSLLKGEVCNCFNVKRIFQLILFTFLIHISVLLWRIHLLNNINQLNPFLYGTPLFSIQSVPYRSKSRPFLFLHLVLFNFEIFHMMMSTSGQSVVGHRRMGLKGLLGNFFHNYFCNSVCFC